MSEYGIRISNGNNQRQIDGRKLVPQLIAAYDMANYPFVESGTDGLDAQSGYICRTYQFNLPPEITSRPYIRFFSLQTTAWVSGIRLMYRSEMGVPVHPKLYFFALDRVDYGNEAYGMRVWNEFGALMYDSGNNHLNASQLFSSWNINVDYDVTRRESYLNSSNCPSPTGSLPASMAICPQHFEHYSEWGNKNESGQARSDIFYTPSGSSLAACMFTYEKTHSDFTSQTSYVNTSVTKSDSMTVMMVDTSIYS